MKDIIIFDLDGTLALIDHRKELVACREPDWDAFYKACTEDEPNQPVIDVCNMLHARGYEIMILSGRSEIVKDETISWLQQNNVKHDFLWMRPANDFTPDDELKELWYNQLTISRKIHCVFDDRDKVVAMWRKNGLTCFQVAAGDF